MNFANPNTADRPSCVADGIIDFKIKISDSF